MAFNWNGMAPQTRRGIVRGSIVALGLAGLAALAFGSKGCLPSFGSSNRSASGSGGQYNVYDGERYRVYGLGGGAEVVRPRNADGSLSPFVYDIEETGGHRDIDPRYSRGPHLHRERADRLVTVEDLDGGRRRVVSQQPGSPIAP